ncbi:hypothetical protein [Absidia glauca]|uniref:Protein HIR n=1 Tax=Absidia glauca TaxID=4829 RepID=A0A163TF89_ABSGL|nr:hypothetical protein [Absidia glauca]
MNTTVKIWNLDPIYSEESERNPTCQKLLCTLSLHGGAVLCVRWSKDGRYLASSSEKDTAIVICELDSATPGDKVQDNDKTMQESWRVVKRLCDHNSDVQDLAWSSDGRYLASCGMDGHIIVWDAQTFEQVHKINHSSFVKGVSWDPVGKYLASQADDKKVKIWRTSDWREEAQVDGPFSNASDTTFFRRLSWSPEGANLAAVNAVNGSQHVAALISRDHWDSDTSLVGHTGPVEVTSFSPKLFYITNTDESNTCANDNKDATTDHASNEGSKEILASVCAIGGQDRGLSIWVTKQSRPLCVARDVFENNVYDLAWTPDGRTLFACSQDGTVACLQMQEELTKPAPDKDIIKSLKQYGYKQSTKPLEATSQLDLEVDNNASTEPQTSQRIADIMGGGNTNGIPVNTNGKTKLVETDTIKSAPTPDSPHHSTTKDTTSQQTHEFTSSSSIAATVTEQKVSIAKNGKRRIQPIPVHRNTGSEQNTATHSPSSTAPSHTNATITQQSLATDPSQETSNYDSPCMDYGTKDSRNASHGNKRKKLHHDDAPISSSLQRTADDEPVRRKPSWVDAAVVPPVVRQSQVRLGLPKVKSVLVNHLTVDGVGITMESHNCSGKQGAECTKLLARQYGNVLWTDYLTSAVLVMTGNRSFTAIGCEDGGILIYSPAGRRLLPPIVLESTPVMMTCNDQWLLCLTATGLLYTWDILHQKSRLSGLSIAPLMHVGQIVSSEEPRSSPSLKDIRIQKNGSPFVITNYHQAFSYDNRMNSWLRISDAWFIISEFWGSGSSTIEQHPLGWLSTALKMTGSRDSTHESIMVLARIDPDVSSTVTISHIENQLAAAIVLESATEYKEWMIYYARRLSKENAQSKVEELCRWLMGPPYMQTDNDEWEPTVLNSISKHELLKELLPILGKRFAMFQFNDPLRFFADPTFVFSLAQNRQLQRITTEYRTLLYT